MAMDPPWLHNSRPLLPPFDGGGMPSGLPGGGMWQPTESLPGPQPDAAGPLFPGFEFRDAATQAALEFSPATAKVLEAFQPLPICEPADAAGLQMTHDEWGVLQDVLRPEVGYTKISISSSFACHWQRDSCSMSHHHSFNLF